MYSDTAPEANTHDVLVPYYLATQREQDEWICAQLREWLAARGARIENVPDTELLLRLRHTFIDSMVAARPSN